MGRISVQQIRDGIRLTLSRQIVRQKKSRDQNQPVDTLLQVDAVGGLCKLLTSLSEEAIKHGRRHTRVEPSQVTNGH
jgi:hypothetical protein